MAASTVNNDLSFILFRPPFFYFAPPFVAVPMAGFCLVLSLSLLCTQFIDLIASAIRYSGAESFVIILTDC
jgi:hypothetical protein